MAELRSASTALRAQAPMEVGIVANSLTVLMISIRVQEASMSSFRRKRARALAVATYRAAMAALAT